MRTLYTETQDLTPVVGPLGTRAATRWIERGSLVLCACCRRQVVFRARTKALQVIVNVYADGVWVRVEHFHEECYEIAGQPFGPPSVVPVSGREPPACSATA